MNGLTVGLLTALPVLLGMLLGIRRGGGRTFAWLSKIFITWGCGIAVTVYGIRAGWHWPAGLITSILAGLLTVLLLGKLLFRRAKCSAPPARLGFVQRASGALLGGIIGFVLAVVFWQVALLTSNLTTPLPPAAKVDDENPSPENVKPSAWAGLAEVAHQGFLKHLPVAGTVTDELLATATIVKTPTGVRKEFAKHKGWDSLAALPSFQAIAADEALFADIDAAVAGNLVALYRLQKHPLIIDFFHEEQLQAIITDLQATEIASELEQFQSLASEPGT